MNIELNFTSPIGVDVYAEFTATMTSAGYAESRLEPGCGPEFAIAGLKVVDHAGVVVDTGMDLTTFTELGDLDSLVPGLAEDGYEEVMRTMIEDDGVRDEWNYYYD